MAAEIQMFGKMLLRLPHHPSGIKFGRKERQLLALLLLHREESLTRPQIVDALWSDCDAQAGHHCLSTAFWRLRQELGSDSGLALEAPRNGDVRILGHDGAWIDLVEFENLVAPILRPAVPRTGSFLGTSEVAALERAAALYRGDLLEDVYDDWPARDRTRLLNDMIGSLMMLGHHFEAARQFDRAIHYISLTLQRDSLFEDAHRALMRIHHAQGRHGAALRQYHACADMLKTELGIEPSAETQRLAQAFAAPCGHFTLPSPDRLPHRTRQFHEISRTLQQLSRTLSDVSTTCASLIDLLATEETGGRPRSN